MIGQWRQRQATAGTDNSDNCGGDSGNILALMVVKTEAVTGMKTRTSLAAAAMATVDKTGTVIVAVATATVAMVAADNSRSDG